MSNRNISISIVITTYNRCVHLINILDLLKKNYLNFPRFEIIICDSRSKDSTKIKIDTFQKNHNYLKIFYLNVKKNINSIKRNAGFLYSNSKYVIFLDDDCYPDLFFVKEFYNLLQSQNRKNKIFCGSVRYPDRLMNKNFIKYRQSRHFVIQKKLNLPLKYLEPEKTVTMNMALDKSNFFYNKKIFNEKFNFYGFEDYDFGYRKIKEKFKILACHPLVYHYDERNFEVYLNKIKFIGLESMKYLIKLNPESAMLNNFFLLENNFLIKFFLKFNGFKYFLIFLKKISIFVEKNLPYSPFVYKVAIAASYLEGCFSRNSFFNKKITYGWYK